jgi:small subunit ribosomal protein S18
MASTSPRPSSTQERQPQQRDSSRAPKRQHRKVCSFCAEKINYIDYKEISRLRRFVSDRGKILPRRVTGTCAKHQRPLTTALERARAIALLPYTTELH